MRAAGTIGSGGCDCFCHLIIVHIQLSGAAQSITSFAHLSLRLVQLRVMLSLSAFEFLELSLALTLVRCKLTKRVLVLCAAPLLRMRRSTLG